MAVELLASLDGDEAAAVDALAQRIFLDAKSSGDLSQVHQRLVTLKRSA
jgi:hypothetical protein